MKAGISLAALLLSLAVGPAQAGEFDIDWWSLDGGGGNSTGDTYAISGFLGQSDAGLMQGGTFVLVGGISGGGAFPSATSNAPLAVTKLQAKLNFAKPKSDSLSLTASVDLGAGFSVAGKSAILSFGGEEVSFTLDAKGKGISYPDTCSLKFSKATHLWTFTSKWKSASCADEWSAYGMTDETIAKPGRPVTVPVVLLIGDKQFEVEKSLTYMAKVGKSGAAK